MEKKSVNKEQDIVTLQVPDNNITVTDMHEYGYTYIGMLPLSTEKAKELYKEGLELYVLYENDTEAAIDDMDEIIEHGMKEGIFGIEIEIWLQYIEKVQKQKNMENTLIFGKQNMFGIYQLKKTSKLAFRNMEELKKKDIKVDSNNYELIYVAPLENMDLDNIFFKFNVDHPKEFTGHSLSISDIVVLQKNNKITSFYVDRLEFLSLPEFIRIERKNDKE